MVCWKRVCFCLLLVFFDENSWPWVCGGVLGIFGCFLLILNNNEWIVKKVSAGSHVKNIDCMFTLPAFSLHLVKVEGLTWFWVVRSSRQPNFPNQKRGKEPDNQTSAMFQRQGHGREDGSQWWGCWWNLRRWGFSTKPADLPVENGLTWWWWLYGYANINSYLLDLLILRLLEFSRFSSYFQNNSGFLK